MTSFRNTAARTGLRQEELRQLIWDDVQLEAAPPRVRVRVAWAKNKKEEFIVLVPEIAEALEAYRPADWSPLDLVFPNRSLCARRLRRDAERNGIAYQDESGRYADFHALRYTWATFLQRNRVAQRFVMNLLRHSDIKLTSKVYTDESQLPIYDAVKGLPRLFGYAHIYAQISGAEGQNGAQPVARSGGNEAAEWTDSEGVSPCLSEPVAVGQMAVREGLSSLCSDCLRSPERPPARTIDGLRVLIPPGMEKWR